MDFHPVFELVNATISIVVLMLALYLRRFFRGGRMESAFKALVVSPIIFAVIEISNALGEVGLISSVNDLIVDLMESLFRAHFTRRLLPPR